ncbi:uncharacterized protein JCM15063_003856 [Sporobolomyces koalae]|uniref:uncharacterized protein n=1 Tax=Sporobolomyces koalae TaxID=500713 RepID=UPI003176B053
MFAVYRDSTASAPAPAPSRRTTGSSNANANSRKNGGFAMLKDSIGGANAIRDKENANPLGKATKRTAQGGKAKKAEFGPEAGDCARKVGLVKVTERPATKPTTLSTTNGICTGTLRTRVLPPLPPLEPESVPENPCVAPVSRSRARKEGSTLPLDRCPDSPASAVDSGYGKFSDLEGGLDFDDESDMSLDVAVVDVGEANRRARALTESPLAEITQAFTGLGRFSNSNVPASPSPSQQILHRHSSIPRRSSPSKSASALPARLRPYSTTSTTRKIKPGQTTAEPPRAAPVARSMRF